MYTNDKPIFTHISKNLILVENANQWKETYIVGELKSEKFLGSVFIRKHPEFNTYYLVTEVMELPQKLKGSWTSRGKLYTAVDAAMSSGNFDTVVKKALPDVEHFNTKNKNEDSRCAIPKKVRMSKVYHKGFLIEEVFRDHGEAKAIISKGKDSFVAIKRPGANFYYIEDGAKVTESVSSSAYTNPRLIVDALANE